VLGVTKRMFDPKPGSTDGLQACRLVAVTAGGGASFPVVVVLR
jgi:hypothetical protein